MSGAIGEFVIGVTPIGGNNRTILPESEPAHIFGNDLQLSATGDLLLVSGVAETRQRILRRLLTNLGDYIWELDYGAGLPAKVGRKANAAQITGIVRSQIFQEQSVAQTPAPKVTVSVNPNGTVTCNITYTDAPTQQPVALTVPLNPPGLL